MSSPVYENYCIRPAMEDADVQLRGRDFAPERRKVICKGLRTLDTLELMAATVYTFQITKQESEINRALIAAMGNEATHYQDFQIKLYEYGFRPSKLRFAYWMVGFIIGFTSRALGNKAILKAGIWVERKAVHHYQELLDTIDWDTESRKVIEKNQADERIHIRHWEMLLSEIEQNSRMT